MEQNNQKFIPGAGPFYLSGNDVGIVMVHGGGGGTSADLKVIAEDLHKMGGYTINVPLLPGFGTSPEDLRKISIKQWFFALNKEISLLREKCNKIIVGGHSMGGILTLILASNNHFDGIFTINAPYGIQHFLIHLVPFFKIFVKYYNIESEKFKKDTNGKWVGYDKIPLNIGTKMKHLLKQMKRILSKINSPALLFQGLLDSDIKKNSMDKIFNKINSKKKKKVWLENNGHPILLCPDHDQIVIELINFITELCP